MGTFLNPLTYLFGREGGRGSWGGQRGIDHVSCNFFDLPLLAVHLHYNITTVCFGQGALWGWWHASGQLWGPSSSKWMVAEQNRSCVLATRQLGHGQPLACGDMPVWSREPTGTKDGLLCSERLLSSVPPHPQPKTHSHPNPHPHTTLTVVSGSD